jgi:hypothetical protein
MFFPLDLKDNEAAVYHPRRPGREASGKLKEW